MDGGAAWNQNIASAVNRCMEVVSDESQIDLDIILDSPTDEFGKWTFRNLALNNLFRFKGIREGYNSMDDIYEALQAYP